MKKQWWHDRIAYQIYPKSFYDTNGDGIGDLQGIIEKLDYLKSLGVGLIWISPFYASPLADQGYDISDYYDIDPRFGTLEDTDRLLQEAEKRDIKIVMDLVVNHCSDEHIWFQEAVKDPQGPYGNYFYIEEGIFDEASGTWKEPYNWRSYFGGPAWSLLPGSDRLFYLHSFHLKQPDLNWTNPKMREDVYEMMNWWMDKGLGGFRLDAIINIKKAAQFKSYEPDRPDGMVHVTRMIEDAEGIGEFLMEMRKRTFDHYESFSVGEVFNAKEDELRDFIGDNGYFSTMFGFDQLGCGWSDKGWWDFGDVDPEDYKAAINKSQKAAIAVDGFLANIIENHDEPRGVSRYIAADELCDSSKKMLGLYYFFLRGIPFIYQGQEIGMENSHYDSIDEVDDISSKDEYETALFWGATVEQAMAGVNRLSRDHARTPFQWSGEKEAGFTTGTPWIKVNPNYVRVNAQDQEKDPESVLNFYREMSKLHRNPVYADVFVYGDYKPYLAQERNLLAYERIGEEHRVLILCNFQKAGREVKLPSEVKEVLINNLSEVKFTGKSVFLEAHQAVILELG